MLSCHGVSPRSTSRIVSSTRNHQEPAPLRRKEGILRDSCITSDRRRLLLHLAVGKQESEACWTVPLEG